MIEEEDSVDSKMFSLFSKDKRHQGTPFSQYVSYDISPEEGTEDQNLLTPERELQDPNEFELMSLEKEEITFMQEPCERIMAVFSKL